MQTATTTQQGIAELATQSETNLGVDATRIVTPEKLRNMLTPLPQTSQTAAYNRHYALVNGFYNYHDGTQYQIPKGTVLQHMVTETTTALTNNTPTDSVFHTLNITPTITGSTLLIDSKLRVKRQVLSSGPHMLHKLQVNGANITAPHSAWVEFSGVFLDACWRQDLTHMGNYSATTAGTPLTVDVVFRNNTTAGGNLTGISAVIRVIEIAP